MNWQEPAALLVVGGTAVLMLVQRIRRFRRRGIGKCGSGCHCAPLEFSADKPYLESPSIRTEKHRE